MDAVGLCKLDIGQHYIDYLAPIGPKSNMGAKMIWVFGHQWQLKPYVQQSSNVWVFLFLVHSYLSK